MVRLKEFDGMGDEEQFLNWNIRNKIVLTIMYDKKPVKCTHQPHLHPSYLIKFLQANLLNLTNFSIMMVEIIEKAGLVCYSYKVSFCKCFRTISATLQEARNIPKQTECPMNNSSLCFSHFSKLLGETHRT